MHLLRRKLERRRPARKLRGRAELLAQREVVDLDDDAVGVEVERPPLVGPFFAERRDGGDACTPSPVRFHRQTPLAHRGEHVAMCRDGLKTVPSRCRAVFAVSVGDALQGVPRRGHDLIGERRQTAFRDESGIEIAHRAGGRVARVLEQGLAGVLPLAVHALERRARQIHFAADLEPAVGRAAELQRNRANRSDIRGHFFAAHAVAAGRPAHEASGLVRQRDAQAVDLQLRDIRDVSLSEARASAHAFVEGAQLLVVVGVVEAEHRHEMLDGVEPFDRTSGNALCRRIGRDEIGVFGFERFELVEQAVELLVRDLGRAADVVTLLVVTDAVAQFFDAVFWRFRRHRFRQA